MSAYSSPTSSAYKSNLKLCRAIEKQPILYDLNHEHYRKRLPSENCWDLVASETGVSVERCKRRWRQIRTEYARWLNTDDHRQRNGLKRSTFYLTKELKFLNSELNLEKDDSPEVERDSKSRSNEPIEPSTDYKAKQKDLVEAVEDEALTKLKVTAAEKKNEEVNENKGKSPKEVLKEAEDKDNNQESETDELLSEEDNSSQLSEGTVPASLSQSGVSSKKAEFFIKQSGNASSNCLIIGKKLSFSSTSTDPLEQMGEDSNDETESVGTVGGGRRPRRVAARNRQLQVQSIQKASEQRLTRLQRRKSMTMAAANSLRSSTSPVKMTPVPRSQVKPPAKSTTPLAKSLVKPVAITVTTSVATSGSPSVAPPIAAPSIAAPSIAEPVDSSEFRDDIFPRPRAVAPVAQQLMLARRPGSVAISAKNLAPSQLPPIRHIGVSRPPGPARVTTLSGGVAKRTFPATVTGPRPAAPSEGLTSVSTATSTSSAMLPPSRLVSTSNTLVISTTSCPVSSINSTTISTSGCSTSTSSSTASITATSKLNIASGAPPSLPVLTRVTKRCERSSQTDSPDIFSDDHFLDMVRPQMHEMNPRQKLHFKQKIFQALMETFDDATDFPGNGEVQHFNINTPSGFEHVSDRELTLVRELVSMISAAKHTAQVGPSSSTSQPAQRVPINKTQVVHRVYKPLQGSSPGSAPGEDKKLYRILQMNNNAKVMTSGLATPTPRKDSVDSNGSLNTPLSATRVGTFVVPSNSPKPTRIQDPLMALFNSNHSTGGSSKGSPAITASVAAGGSAKEPLLVRQMGRRYSVCGSGGPSTNQASGSPLESMLLKRRLAAPSSLSLGPPQQRARYSQSSSALAPGNSLLVRRAQKQPSPTGGGSIPHKTPQIANTQGSSFNAFATPNSVRGNTVSGVTSPQKRCMVIANVKATPPQKTSTVSANSSMANLLAESRPPSVIQNQTQAPAQSQSLTQSQPTRTPESQTAGIIAADDFDMIRLKREPQDIVDDDILGM